MQWWDEKGIQFSALGEEFKLSLYMTLNMYHEQKSSAGATQRQNFIILNLVLMQRLGFHKYYG